MEQETIFDSSNLVTFARIILVFVAVYLLLSGNANFYLITFILIIVIVLMDYVDGLVARIFKSITRFGSVLDIVGDRIVENVLWITFAYTGVIPLWIPIAILSRSFITDSFRNFALSRGRTAFGKKTMMRGNIGIFFVSSRFSRTLYAVAKAATFSFLALQLYFIDVSYVNIEIFKNITHSLVLFTVAFCILRGFFVVYDGFMLFTNHRSQ
tara:strand:+ start:1278 stop:1910 length:633 start_codon:yes stop_codon:yes gene_type:complete